jgi:hypothetical protein
MLPVAGSLEAEEFRFQATGRYIISQVLFDNAVYFLTIDGKK